MKSIFRKSLFLLPLGALLLGSCSDENKIEDGFTYDGTDVFISNVYVEDLGTNADSTSSNYRVTLATSGIERDTTGMLMGNGSSIVLELVSELSDELEEGSYIIDDMMTGEDLTGSGAIYFDYDASTTAAASAVLSSGTIEIEEKWGADRYEIEIEALDSNGDRFEMEWNGKVDFEEEEEDDDEG